MTPLLPGIAFAAPALLAALLVLPVIWWLLRVTPPAPRRQSFPAIRILAEIERKEEMPDRTPWWLLLLRMVAAALVILALAGPIANPETELPNAGPVLLVVDDGWASARGWTERRELALDIADRAERAGRPVVLLRTAPRPGEAGTVAAEPIRAADARAAIEAIEPSPWPTDRTAVLSALEQFEPERSAWTVWLSDGIASPDAAVDAALAERTMALGGLELVRPEPAGTARLVRPPVDDGRQLEVTLERAARGASEPVVLRGMAEDGRVMVREQAVFEEGETESRIALDLPAEARNALDRLAIEGEASAGATVLLDERWRRRPVGIATSAFDTAQPLLSDAHYLESALAPFAETRIGSPEELLAGAPQSPLALLVLPDSAGLAEAERDQLAAWVEAGGVLVRFAGPRLADRPDELVPVELRAGDRALTGALTWATPQPLAPFPEASPFVDLPIADDIRVERQVLAEPTLDLQEKTWARLADGTPLVTADRRGEGWVVLVHTTAGPTWSSLPLSGLFVDMLRRLVSLGAGVASGGGPEALVPYATLDGRGVLGAPPATAAAIVGSAFEATPAGPTHPPGFYGVEEARRALNLSAGLPTLAALPPAPLGATTAAYGERGETDLKPPLLALALVLLLVDFLISLGLRGAIRLPRRAAAAGLALALAGGMAIFGGPARAQDDERALVAANGLWLAYVETGDPDADRVAKAGLDGLARYLADRTSVESEGALAVDPETDELSFFPLIYWAISPAMVDPSPQAISNLERFMRNGGTILFDTRDQAMGGTSGIGTGPGGERLRLLAERLDLPPITPVPPDHVLTKSFYLMQDFPGRFQGGDVWVATPDATRNDGVSSIVIGSNDWVGAWAIDERGRPLLPVSSGNERQRELAVRFGINLVMYILTGNYKADQVHVPAILERLGQ